MCLDLVQIPIGFRYTWTGTWYIDKVNNYRQERLNHNCVFTPRIVEKIGPFVVCLMIDKSMTAMTGWSV